MQAAEFNIAARDKYTRLIAQGDAAVRSAVELPVGLARLPLFLQAQGLYSAAWGQAELAITSTTSKEYTAWSTRRAAANAKSQQVQTLIVSLVGRCCFEGCSSPATQRRGGDMVFPMCETHYQATKAGAA